MNCEKDSNKTDEPVEMVETNIGKMPAADYREIKAVQFGFESYADMRRQGYRL